MNEKWYRQAKREAQLREGREAEAAYAAAKAKAKQEAEAGTPDQAAEEPSAEEDGEAVTEAEADGDTDSLEALLEDSEQEVQLQPHLCIGGDVWHQQIQFNIFWGCCCV